MAVATGLPGHDGPLAVLPEEVVALLDAQAVMKRIRNDEVSAAIRPQAACATAFEQLRGVTNPQLHPKGKLQQLVARGTPCPRKDLIRKSLIEAASVDGVVSRHAARRHAVARPRREISLVESSALQHLIEVRVARYGMPRVFHVRLHPQWMVAKRRPAFISLPLKDETAVGEKPRLASRGQRHAGREDDDKREEHAQRHEQSLGKEDCPGRAAPVLHCSVRTRSQHRRRNLLDQEKDKVGAGAKNH